MLVPDFLVLPVLLDHLLPLFRIDLSVFLCIISEQLTLADDPLLQGLDLLCQPHSLSRGRLGAFVLVVPRPAVKKRKVSIRCVGCVEHTSFCVSNVLSTPILCVDCVEHTNFVCRMCLTQKERRLTILSSACLCSSLS